MNTSDNAPSIKHFTENFQRMNNSEVNTFTRKRLLFLCTENTARSQMAEAILKHRAADTFEVYSAGSHAAAIDPRTLKILKDNGIPSDDLYAKDIAAVAHLSFDYVITLCDEANTAHRSYPNAKKQISWDFADPKTLPNTDGFSTTFNALNSRLSTFLQLEENCGNGNKNQALASASSNQAIDIDPIAFYKCLTDDIRLKALMLSNYQGELCVCELMLALDEKSQPKVSRNLAVLKKANIISDRKHGQWVFYRINPGLPLWAKSVLAQTTENNIALIDEPLRRLGVMQNRPDKATFCQ